MIKNEARKYNMTWVQGGMKVDGEGNPKLLKNAAYTIIKFLLPKVDILGTVRLGEFKTVKVCMKWLGVGEVMIKTPKIFFCSLGFLSLGIPRYILR
jgi:hypothetical protein